MSLNGKVALVTGAGRGIGLAIAEELARRGARIAIGDINRDLIAKVNDHFKSQNLVGQGFYLDVSNTESTDVALKEIETAFGAMPQILVNNAGITRDNLLMRMSDAEWDQVIATNLTSVFRLSRAVIRSMMKERFGRIINIASIVGITGNPGQANYTAAKAGVIALTKSLAKEVASRSITVNAVAPGYIATDMTDRLNDKQKEEILKLVPMGRPGTPSDIAKGVAFLASEDASYITGTTLVISGGMTA